MPLNSLFREIDVYLKARIVAEPKKDCDPAKREKRSIHYLPSKKRPGTKKPAPLKVGFWIEPPLERAD
jgi:hypothetical protein